MEQLLMSFKNKEHSQKPIIILPCVCCLKKLFFTQSNEENEHSCDDEIKSKKHNEKAKKHHHHHHKHVNNKDNIYDRKNEKEEEKIEKKKKRKHTISNEIVEQPKNKKSKTRNKKNKDKDKEVIKSKSSPIQLPSPPSPSNTSKNDNDNEKVEKKKKMDEKEKENKNEKKQNEESNDGNDSNDDGFEIKKAEFSLRIAKPEWIPPRQKYGERIDDNPKPKKKRKSRKKQQKNDSEYIEKNRNSISFTPTVEKKKEPYFNLQSVQSEYESIDNPLIGDKIQFKLFDCEMEGDEMSFPSFCESDPMIGDVLGKNVIDDIEHIVIKLENGEEKTYLLTLMSDVRLIKRCSEKAN